MYALVLENSLLSTPSSHLLMESRGTRPRPLQGTRPQHRRASGILDGYLTYDI